MKNSLYLSNDYLTIVIVPKVKIDCLLFVVQTFMIKVKVKLDCLLFVVQTFMIQHIFLDMIIELVCNENWPQATLHVTSVICIEVFKAYLSFYMS